MPKRYRKKLGNILHNEGEMLSTARGLNVPRIVKPFGTAHAPGGMDCLLLERASFLLILLCKLMTGGLTVH